MNETHPLNLTLGEPPAGLKRREAGVPWGLLWLIVLLQLAAIGARGAVAVGARRDDRGRGRLGAVVPGR